MTQHKATKSGETSKSKEVQEQVLATGYEPEYVERVVKLRSKLKHGDLTRCSELTKFSHPYCYKVVHLERRSEMIVETLETLIAQRAELHRKLKAMSVVKRAS